MHLAPYPNIFGISLTGSLINNVPTYKDVPSSTDLSKQIAKDLKKRGFKFLGPTTIYSFLQATGFVNDHENDCDFK